MEFLDPPSDEFPEYIHGISLTQKMKFLPSGNYPDHEFLLPPGQGIYDHSGNFLYIPL